jgi:hypothetical protein
VDVDDEKRELNMKRLTDQALLEAEIELLVLRLSVHGKRLSMNVQDSFVSPAMQGWVVNSAMVAMGLAGAYGAALIGAPLVIGAAAGVALGVPTYKPLSKYLRETKPQNSYARLRSVLAELLEYDELHRPLALIVAEAIKAQGADNAHFDKALARYEAGELDDLSFAAQALALAPQCWGSVCQLAYNYHFKKAELLTRRIEKARADAPAPERIETQIMTPDGVNLRYTNN